MTSSLRCLYALAIASIAAPCAVADPTNLSTSFSEAAPDWLVSRFPKVEIREDTLVMTRGKGHASSIGVPLETEDIRVTHRFRLSEDGEFSIRFEYGYNLHLCRLSITPSGATLRIDQPNGVKDDAEPVVLAESTQPITPGEWHELTFSSTEDQLSANIDGIRLSGQHSVLKRVKTSTIWALTRGSLAIDNLSIQSDHGTLVQPLPFSGGPRPIPVIQGSVAADPTPPAGANPNRALGIFHDYVEPILKTHCYDCHSHEAKKAKGGLVLDSLNPMLQGGDLGPALIPGDAHGSLLLEALLYENNDLQMPPDSKLSDTDIAYVREWIELGAAHPRTGPEVAEESPSGPNAAELWSVQPFDQSPVPEDASGWSHTNVDRFLKSQLDRADLEPSADATPQVLIRRLHEVLTGLPPTIEETTAFVSAAEKNLEAAMEQTIDKLLDSDHFGERWGRHWLDVARYADVNGATNPKPFDQAWRYRDYVIHSFNEDKPWDEFVREQIAGDLLTPKNPIDQAEKQIATGYLALSHVLAVDRDKERLKLDTIDEQLDVLGKTFLGIQIGCARCHDHKIDPFPTRDYYALAGIFRSTETLKGSDSQETIEAAGAELGETSSELDWLMGGKGVRIHSAADADQQRNEPIHLRGEPDMLGEVVPRGFPTLLTVEGAPDIPEPQSGRKQLAEWLLADDNVIVRSTDNFGFTGDTPSHPLLLDFLAQEFRNRHQFQFKSLIRDLMLSRAFRQSSDVRPEAMEIDPENRLVWRSNLRRRDAETLLDSIRFVAGILDTRDAQGTAPEFKRGNQASTSQLAIPKPTLAKRAIYWPVFRKDVPLALDLMGLFDFPPATSPRGTRAVTQVPSQSLALLNSPTVLDAARALSKSVTQLDEAQRIPSLYQRLFARRPSPTEKNQVNEFLTQFTRDLAKTGAAKADNASSVAWNRLCHTLLVSNEFIIVP